MGPPIRPDLASFLPDFRENVVVVALLGLLGGRGELGRVGRHGKLFPDGGGGGRTSQFSRIQQRSFFSCSWHLSCTCSTSRLIDILRRGGGGGVTNDDLAEEP